MKKLILLLTLALWTLDGNAQNDEKTYQEFEVAKPAEYPGGINAFRRELQKNVVYPSIAKRKGIQGNVVLNFTIDEQGNIINIKILRDIGEGCGEASVKALGMMTTKWQPALDKNGKAVKMMKTVPIAFMLSGGSPTREQDTIVAPEYIGKIEIKTLEASELYEGCGNHVLITGATDPQFVVTNGSYVLIRDNKNKITVIPNDGSKTITIGVRENNKLVGRRTFLVKKVPPATLHVFVDGKEMNLPKGISIKNLKKITLKGITNEDFAGIFPDETEYRMDYIKYALKRSNEAVLTSENITEISKKAKKGDVLEIQVNDIKRVNFRGSVLPTKVSNPVITIPIL